LNILCVGANFGTSRHRWQALERLGHRVARIDPVGMFGLRPLINICIWRMGGFGIAALTYLYVWAHLRGKRYDLCVVNPGETVAPPLVRLLKRRCSAVACFNADNPFVKRDGCRWDVLRRALPFYDAYCTIRPSSALAAKSHGARKVLCLPRTADEIVHRRRPYDAADAQRFASEVAFVGTWMPERGPFAAHLLEAGVPLRIFGPNWRKAPEYERIRHAIAIDAFLGDDDYVKAIQYSKIALGLLSVGNEDVHTARSLEAPAIGALFCAQRTPEHAAMYAEGVEAIFWSDAAECARLCLELLADPQRLARIARAGRRRVLETGHFNEELMRTIIEETLEAVRQ
jgi:spore maturation protein CgeB